MKHKIFKWIHANIHTVWREVNHNNGLKLHTVITTDWMGWPNILQTDIFSLYDNENSIVVPENHFLNIYEFVEWVNQNITH